MIIRGRGAFRDHWPAAVSQGDSAIRAGFAITPFAVGVSVVASAAVVPRIGRGDLQVGAGLMAVGSLWTWQVVDSDVWRPLPDR